MIILRNLFWTSAILLRCLPLINAATLPTQQQSGADAKAVADDNAFRELLKQVDITALHEALHAFSPRPFKHGIFREDITAVQAVHRENAPLATTIVQHAKRQESGNGTTTVTTSVTVATIVSTSTVVVPPTSVAATDSPTVVAPPPTSTADGPPSETSPLVSPTNIETISSLPASQAPSTVVVTNTEVIPSTSTVFPSTSIQLGPGPETTTPLNPATLTSGAIFTTTDAQGVTIVSTIDGGYITLSVASGASATESGSGSGSSKTTTPITEYAPSSTSVVLRTTTLPNGQQSTITAVTVVQGSATGVQTPSGTAGVAQTTTTGPSPGLQTNLAPRSREYRWEVVGVIGGAVGFAMVL
ncbi:hypothetical protein MMC25_007299 [Agyrium rufum]|nr:hypothetical protein [Agyrium rufum]